MRKIEVHFHFAFVLSGPGFLCISKKNSYSNIECSTLLHI
uniref:Uncharacterized protein n=1 Tax=Arundo donax TaxID=35708 RepID=A0A0A9FIQ4_ARUDO